MKTIKFDENYDNMELTWDDELKFGDLITAYHKGYYTFIKFVNRTGWPPLAHFYKAYSANGKPCKSKKIMGCDASYCRKAIDQIKAEIEKRKNEIAALEKVLKEENAKSI